MKRKVIYYAHHMNKYNTLEEIKEYESILENFNEPVVINPNGWIYQCGDNEYIMGQCYQLVKQCDTLVFSSIEDGVIGRGVYGEIECALCNNIKVFYLNDNKFTEFTKDDYINRIGDVEGKRTNRRFAKIN